MKYIKNVISAVQLKTEKQKILLVSGLTISLIFLTYCLHRYYHIQVVFTHLYYIPIVMASLWWHKKGIYLACCLGLFLIMHSFFFITQMQIGIHIADILRAMMFLAIATITAILSDNFNKIERTKQANESKYRKLVDYIDSGVAIYIIIENGTNFVIKEFNPAAKKIDNIKKQKIAGKNILEVFPKIKEDGLFKVLQQVAITGKAQYHDTTLYMDNEIAVWKKHYVYRLSPKEVVVVYKDVTQRKIAENRLKKNEKKIRTIMESMQEPVYISSKDFTIEYMNSAMIQRIGEDATGRRCFNAIHGFDKKCPWCNYNFIQKGNSHEFDIVNPKDNHSLHISSAPIYYKDDNSVSILNVLRDTTEIKQIEARLQHSQKMEAIGTLAGGIAHDFNNILFPIMALTEMMLDDSQKDSQNKDFLDQILTACARAKDLIKQILTFSRQNNTQITPLKIQPVVKEIVKLAKSGLPSTIKIDHFVSPNGGKIMADPTKIHQIIMNLITNAFHAMEDTNGGILTIEVNSIQVTPDNTPDQKLAQGAYVCLTITDTGIGMNELTIQKIFEPYFTTKDKEKGTGLGLSVVHGIVKSNNGEIFVQSQPGKGTTFNIYFPEIVDTFDFLATTTSVPIPTGNERIGLIDDEETITSVLKQILERLGYTVISSSSSTAFLETFRAAPDTFDIIITDMTMPNLTGDRLAHELKKIRSDIPIILCSGFSEEITNNSNYLIEIDEILIKPFSKDKLALAIRKALSSKQSILE